MTFSSKIALAIAGAVFVVVLLFASYVNAVNYGNSTEQSLRASLADVKNVYANGTQQVMEVAQVPEMYRNDLTKLVTAEIAGRYGNDGSKATLQFLKEQNPTLDASVYLKVQQVIEGFRDNFTLAQRGMIDKVRSYRTSLGNFWDGFWLRLAGYPKINFADYDIVTTAKTDDAFKTHQDQGITLPQ